MKKLKTLIAGVLAAVAATAFGAPAEPVDSVAAAGEDTVQNGSYYWVPDSLRHDVEKVLQGRSRVVDDERKLDLNEYTVFRGDTIPMIMKDLNLGRQRFRRGLYNHLFIPKGMWNFGLSVSYGEFSTTDLEMFDMLNDIDLNAHSFSIKPYLSYCIRNNLAVGVRFNYDQTKGGIGSFKVDIDDDMNFNLHDIHYDSETYSTALFLQQYIGITRRGRFGISNEVSLAFASGTSHFQRPYAGEPKETATTYTDLRLTFSPGVCVFIMKNVSFNLSFGVLGFYLRNEKQKVNGEDLGNRLTSGANFKINIFNLAMGIGVHI